MARHPPSRVRRRVPSTTFLTADGRGAVRSVAPVRLGGLAALGQGPQPAVRAVEDVLVAGHPATVRILPEGVEAPAARQPAAAAGRVVGDPQWVPLAETRRVPGASVPPVGGGVD